MNAVGIETALVLKAAAAIWVMYLAMKLWVTGSKDVMDRSVTARRIFVTTTLNPKALVFGLVLLPPPIAPDFLPKLTIFVALASIVAVIWGLIGRLTQVGVRSHWRLMILQRTASGWLAIVEHFKVLCAYVIDQIEKQRGSLSEPDQRFPADFVVF